MIGGVRHEHGAPHELFGRPVDPQELQMATGRVVVGALLALAGIVWTLQGLGYVGGSFMSGATIWAVIGPVTALIGLALAATGWRRR